MVFVWLNNGPVYVSSFSLGITRIPVKCALEEAAESLDVRVGRPAMDLW